MTEKVSKTISEYLSRIGRKGGKSGQGESKVRGDREYYSKIGKIRKRSK